MENKNNKLNSKEFELVARAKAGDEDAFKELYNLHKGRILAYLYNYLGDYHKAEELCQDTFLSCYRHLATYEPREKFSSWLYKIATNLAKDELRRRRREKEKVHLEVPIRTKEGKELILGDVIPDSSLRPDVELRQRELEAHLLGTIDSLSPKYRDVILLCDVQGLSYEEVAKVLNCTAGTVGFRLYQARRMLRKKLKIGFGDLEFYLNVAHIFDTFGKGVGKMLCPMLKVLLSYYIDGECSPYLTRLVERHLEVCPGCYAELNLLQESVIIASQLNPALTPSPLFDLEFEKRLEGIRAEERPMVDWQDMRTRLREGLDILVPPIFVPRPIPIPVPVRAIASILLVFTLSFSFYNLRIGYPPAIMVARGDVSIYSPRMDRRIPLIEGRKLSKGDIIYVDAGLVDIELEKVYRLRLKRDTRLAVNSITRSRKKGLSSLDLNKGMLLAKTESRFSGSELKISTPTGTAQVYGTEFILVVPREQDLTRLLVEEGEVRFTSHYGKDRPDLASQVIVTEGQKIETRFNELPGAPTSLTADEKEALREIDEIGRIPEALRPGEEKIEDISTLKVILALSMTPNRVREIFKPYSLAFETTKGRETRAHRLLKEAITLAGQAEKEDNQAKHIGSIHKLEKIVKSYPNPNYNPQLLIYIGSYYEQLSMDADALKAFQEVVDKYPDSKWASLTQCAIGIIYEERLNNAAKAKESYQKVIENYPESLEVTEARNGLSRLK